MKVPQSTRDLVDGAESLIYIEDFSSRKGVLQAINPVAKLITIAAMIVAALCIYELSYLLAICLVPIILAATSTIPLKHFFSRTVLVLLFVAFIGVPSLFMINGSPIFSINLGVSTLTATYEGLTSFLVFTVRVWFCVASLSLLILSTGFDKTLKLLSSLKVPAVVVQLFALTYRYFFVSIHEAQSVLIAKEARTYMVRRTINIQSLRDLGNILATLFIRTFERSERVYLAMKARGFQVDAASKLSIPSMHVTDVFFTSSIIVTFALFAIL